MDQLHVVVIAAEILLWIIVLDVFLLLLQRTYHRHDLKGDIIINRCAYIQDFKGDFLLDWWSHCNRMTVYWTVLIEPIVSQ